MVSAVRAHAADPFFSLKPTGRGLGLSSVASLVRQLRGTFQIESTPAGGTCVSVDLPLAPGTDPTSAHHSPGAPN
jgi:signal transduction histidine kinase